MRPGSASRTFAASPPIGAPTCCTSTCRDRGSLILVDHPLWPARGRLWSHLVSDLSYAELHVFAEMLGSPRRAFDRDHYDIPEQGLRPALCLGATLLPSRELAFRLRAWGLRRPKHLHRAGAD